MWIAARNLLLSPVLLWVAPVAEDGASSKQCDKLRQVATAPAVTRDGVGEVSTRVSRRAPALLP